MDTGILVVLIFSTVLILAFHYNMIRNKEDVKFGPELLADCYMLTHISVFLLFYFIIIAYENTRPSSVIILFYSIDSLFVCLQTTGTIWGIPYNEPTNYFKQVSNPALQAIIVLSAISSSVWLFEPDKDTYFVAYIVGNVSIFSVRLFYTVIAPMQMWVFIVSVEHIMNLSDSWIPWMKKTKRYLPSPQDNIPAIIPPLYLQLRMVNSQIRKTRCIGCERGYIFVHNAAPKHLADLYICRVHKKCSIADKVKLANT